MVRHVSLLLFVVIATAVAGCRAHPLAPSAASALSLDTEDPPCADTVWVDTSTTSGARSAEPDGSESSGSCHVVIINY